MADRYFSNCFFDSSASFLTDHVIGGTFPKARFYWVNFSYITFPLAELLIVPQRSLKGANDSLFSLFNQLT